MVDKTKILVLDIETTDINPQVGMICEIAVVILDLKTKKIEVVINEIIKEHDRFDKNAWIFQNSDLTVKDVMEKGIPLENIREKLQHCFNIYRTCAYSSNFDFSFLESRNFRIPNKLKDPMFIATNILKIRNSKGFKYPKVTECMKYYKIEGKEPHRALGDVYIEAEIILKMNCYQILE
jgi:DNA polymerase III epsilon subunit-like protein